MVICHHGENLVQYVTSVTYRQNLGYPPCACTTEDLMATSTIARHHGEALVHYVTYP